MKEYRKKTPLTREHSDFDVRHLPIAGGGAPLVALLGADKDEQAEANWDNWKLIGGGLAGGGLGGFAGYRLGKLMDEKNGTGYGSDIGALAGALGGSLLGHYITFKTMANNRGVDSDYDIRHLPFLGGGADVVALHGYSPEDQVEANWNNLKIKIPQIATTTLGIAMLPGAGSAIGQGVGGLMYDTLKNNKMRQQRDN